MAGKKLQTQPNNKPHAATKAELNPNLVHRAGSAVTAIKSNGVTGWVEGYLVSWGNSQDTDLQGEHFSPRTEFCLDWFQDRPVLYHHGLDGDAGLRKIGSIKSVESDDLGLWVQAQLDLRDRYASAVYDMVKSKEFGWSSGSVDHLVKIANSGEIAVWPLIEGSITPTPAQPAKTSVRAFKAVLSGDNTFGEFVKGFDARVKSANSLYVPEEPKLYTLGGAVKSGQVTGDGSMARQSSKRLARVFANAFGVKADEADLNAVASEVESHVDEEVAQAAADELEAEAAANATETEVALAALEKEMTGDIKTMGRFTNRSTDRNSRLRRSNAYRNVADEVITEAGAIASEIEDELTAQMSDIADEVADSIAAELEAEAVQSVRAARRAKLRRSKMTEIEAGGTGEESPDYLGEESSVVPPDSHFETAKSNRRQALRRMSRKDGLEVAPEAAIEAADDAVLLEEIAEKAYRNGFKKGIQRTMRAVVPTEEAVQSEEEMVTAVQSDMTDPEAAKRAYRKGYQAAIRRARKDGEMLADPAAMDGEEDFGAVQSDEMEDMTTASMRRLSNRRSNGRKSVSGSGDSYWRNRAMKAEMMEAEGERSFGNVRVTRDAADQPNAYGHAFKSYLYNGLGMMTDSEKYALRAKGQVTWGAGSFGYDGNNVVSGKAVKTYFGGIDGGSGGVGFAVPPDWVSELNKNIMQQTVMAQECKTRTTTSDRIVQPNLITTDARRAHAAQVRWPGEIITDPTETRTIEDQYSQVDVPVHVMLLSLTAGNSALEDVTFSLEDEINEAFSEAVAVAYDELIWGGDGQGKLEGIVTNSQVTGTRSTGVQSVSGYIPTGSPDGIVTADTLKEMLFNLPRGYRQKAKWYMNSNTALQIATLKDGEGNYLIDHRDEGLQSIGVPDRLLSRPIVINEYADDIAENAFPIVLGDLSRGYIIGKRVDFSIRRFDDSAYAQLDQVLFLGRARLGGQVLMPAAIKVLKVSAS